MGDMLERQRQNAKAQAKFQKASAHLEAAKNVEQQQANQPRKSKALTVAGNSLYEMTDAVCAVCGQWTPDMRILVQEFLRRNYQALYDVALWPESCIGLYQTVVGQQLILPQYVDRVIGIRGGDNIPLVPTEIMVHFQLDPTVFESSGTPYGFSMLTPVGVSALPPVPPEALILASTSASDKSNVFVRGESGGEEFNESITLNGTTPVSTIKQYDVPITVAKDITVGDVSVTGSVSSAVLEVIPANERQRKHQRVWLLPDPGTTPTQSRCLVLAKRKIRPLLTDQDTPIITGAQTVLIAGAAADLMQKLGQNDQANSLRSRADAAAKVLINLNTDQNAYMPRFIPDVAPTAYVGGGSDWSYPTKADFG